MEIYHENKNIKAGNVTINANIVVSQHPSAKVGSVVVTECWSYYDESLEKYLANRLNTVSVTHDANTTPARLRDAIQAADSYFYLVRLLAERANERMIAEQAGSIDN